MEYIILWILALFGLWSLISNILESFYVANREESFDIMLNVHNKEDSVEYLIKQLSKMELVRKIIIYDQSSTDSTKKIIKEIQKNNSKVILEEKINGI